LRFVEHVRTSPPPALGLEVHLELHELVVRCVGNDERAVWKERDLARESQRALRRGRRRIRGIPPAQRPLGRVLGDELVDESGDAGRVALTGHRGDDVPLRVDHDKGRPGSGGVRLPRHQLGVVEDGVPHGIALDRGLDRRRVALVLELRRVHPENDELLGEPLLDRPQLVEHVKTVNAAERPEVEQDDASAELGERQGVAAGVEPAPADQLGRPNPDVSAHEKAGAGRQGPESRRATSPPRTGRPRR
jgi:hypothetical protein